MPEEEKQSPATARNSNNGHAEVHTASGEGQVAPTAPHPIWPAYVAWLLLLALSALVGAVWYWMRRSALRAWKTYAAQIGAEFAAKNQFSPAYVSGQVQNRDIMLTTGITHDDDAPYFHTRAQMPLRNRAGFVMGLRRKSLLEEAQTRREPSTFTLEDAEFERLFFVVCNDAEALTAILTPEIRRELRRYGDVEVYIHLNRIEWRRPGEQSDLQGIRRLTDALASMAASVDTLPASPRTLTQRLADENMIAKGV